MGEKSGKVIEKATGGDTEVNVDGEEITFKNKEGEAVTLAVPNGRILTIFLSLRKAKLLMLPVTARAT